ncbi:MAG: hypothetical protein JJLCMIEE_00880 [Acidimicrobiales bacterium]|nr:hypothetical protein [Acidimicrobiales bacterium]
MLRIDAGGRQALFVSLADDPFELGNALCDLHAEGTSVPRGWTFTDGREDQTSMLVGSRTKRPADVPGPTAESDPRTGGGSRRTHRPQRRRPRVAQPGLFGGREDESDTEAEHRALDEAVATTADSDSTDSTVTDSTVTDSTVTHSDSTDSTVTHSDSTDSAAGPPTDPEGETGVFQRFAETETSEDLDAILDADSPLLSRAFRGVRSSD